MYVIHEVMQCKPGKVRDMVERFKKLNAIAPRLGLKPSRILTDVSGEQFWTVVGLTEVESLEAFFASMEKFFADAEARKIMEGYHDLVVNGRREIYRVEG
jgi:hypothetical protein